MYATQQQIQIAAGGASKLIELTDQSGAGVLDLNVLADAQAKADLWINGFLGMRYALPVGNLSPDGSTALAAISADETIYQLLSARRMIDQQDIEKHKERADQLALYREGKLRLQDPQPFASNAQRSAVVSLDGCGSLTRDGLKGVW